METARDRAVRLLMNALGADKAAEVQGIVDAIIEAAQTTRTAHAEAVQRLRLRDEGGMRLKDGSS
jgi:hypothetical protein